MAGLEQVEDSTVARRRCSLLASRALWRAVGTAALLLRPLEISPAESELPHWAAGAGSCNMVLGALAAGWVDLDGHAGPAGLGLDRGSGTDPLIAVTNLRKRRGRTQSKWVSGFAL